MASLLRAGHAMGVARALLAQTSPEEAESWVAEAGEAPSGGFGTDPASFALSPIALAPFLR
jgi:hypothetical protein